MKRRPSRLRQFANALEVKSADAATLISAIGKSLWRLYNAAATLAVTLGLVILGANRWWNTLAEFLSSQP